MSLSDWASKMATKAIPKPATTDKVEAKVEPKKENFPAPQPMPPKPIEPKKQPPTPTPIPESVRMTKVDTVEWFESKYKDLGEAFRKVAQYALDVEDDNIKLVNQLDEAVNKIIPALRQENETLKAQIASIKPMMEMFKMFQATQETKETK
jgi:protein-tyrosine phosphatase